MKSLVLTSDLPDRPDTGGRIRSRVLLAALVRHGPVEVAAPLGDGERDARRDRLAADLGLAVTSLSAASSSRTSPLRKLRSWVRGDSEVFGRRWAPGCAAVVRALVAERRPDLIVADTSHVLPVLPRDPGAPFLFHLHNVESALLARPDEVRRPLAERLARGVEARLIAQLEARFARQARLCIAVSERDRERLLDLCPGARVEVVENSIDIAALPCLEPSPAPSPLLLFVGTYDYPPNREAIEELVVRHLPVLRARWPDLRVRLVGSDPSGAAARLARAEGVEAVGRVADLLPHYREATAVYLPIRSGGGTRLKVMEAFALGRPVLATEVAVEGLGVVPGEHYHRVEDPTAGVAALEQVLAARNRTMVGAARALVEQRWSHAAAIDQLAEAVGAAFGAASFGSR